MPMNDDRYERSIDELEVHACKWWPSEVKAEARSISILYTLLDSQDKFIALLKLANKNNPSGLFDLINASEFSWTKFLKHLIVLVDFGSEPLQRINKDFTSYFPEGKLKYNVGNGDKEYTFSVLPVRGTLNNDKMQISTIEDLNKPCRDIELCKDIIMILLYGAASTDSQIKSIFTKCTISDYLGKDEELETFVRQNYIRVSRIIAGKDATDLGNAAQHYVVTYLSEHLGINYNVKMNGTVPGVTQNNGNTLTNFDVVVDRVDDNSRHKKYVAIEVTFQETTNSTIERKGGQAVERFNAIASTRNYIAYIIDGAGNFARRAAVRVLCENSHCTVAYTHDEFQLLIEFIKEKIG